MVLIHDGAVTPLTKIDENKSAYNMHNKAHVSYHLLLFNLKQASLWDEGRMIKRWRDRQTRQKQYMYVCLPQSVCGGGHNLSVSR